MTLEHRYLVSDHVSLCFDVSIFVDESYILKASRPQPALQQKYLYDTKAGISAVARTFRPLFRISVIWPD